MVPEANLIDIQERLRKLIENFKYEENKLEELKENINRNSKSISILAAKRKDLPVDGLEERAKLLKEEREYEKAIQRDQLLIQDIEYDRSLRNTPGNKKLEEVVEKMKLLPGEMIMFIWNLIEYFEAEQRSKLVDLNLLNSPTNNSPVPKSSSVASADKNSSKGQSLSNYSNTYSLDGWRNKNITQSLVPQTNYSYDPGASNSSTVRRSLSTDEKLSKHRNTYNPAQSLIPYTTSSAGNTFQQRSIQSLSLDSGIFALLPSNSSTSESFSKFTNSLFDSLGPKQKTLNSKRNDDPTIRNQTLRFEKKMIGEAHHEKQQIEQREAMESQIQQEKINEKRVLDIRRRESEAFEKQRNADNDRKRDIEFQKKMNEKGKEIEQNVKKAKENRERYEKETKQLIDDVLNRSRQACETLLYCLQMQFQFEQKEKEWAECLQTLRDAIAIAKNQFSNFSYSLGREQMYRKDDPIIESEIKKMHRLTLIAYNLICNVWYKMEPSSRTAYADRIFLRILLANFTAICKKLYNVLKAIDDFESQKVSLKTLSDAFSKVNAFDVYDTRQLRDLSKTANPADYDHIDRPIQYIKSTQITFI